MSREARPANADDLKMLLQALERESVEYILIGGYALFALGYRRGTVDIDLLLPRSRETGERVKRALMFNACGETYESLVPHIVTIDLDGVPVRTLDLEGLLKTKQSARDKDRLDRMVIERAILAAKGGGNPDHG